MTPKEKIKNFKRNQQKLKGKYSDNWYNLARQRFLNKEIFVERR